MNVSSDVEEHRSTPLLGSGPITTYEILYCKIKKRNCYKLSVVIISH